jgi:hypothetical protein
MSMRKFIAAFVTAAALAAPAIATAANCSVSPSPAAAFSTVVFHADTLHGDNYLSVCGPYYQGFSAGCPGLFDLGHVGSVDIPYLLDGPGTYTFTVSHENGFTTGNIGGYLQCTVSLEAS